MRVRINPYNAGSRSAKMLSSITGFLRLKKVGGKFRPRADDVVINWGDSSCPDYSPARVLNSRESIINATNKLKSFQLFAGNGVRIPDYWTSYDDCPRDTKIVGRSVLTGHSGEGISIGKRGDDSLSTTAPLYTRYIFKKEEFRVHVVGGRVVFIQRKARKHDVEDPNWEVRNLAGGFVFVSYADGYDECTRSAGGLSTLAAKATDALGLDFGAVDIVMDKNGELFVLEVNTACGLEERTARKYADAFKEYLNG